MLCGSERVTQSLSALSKLLLLFLFLLLYLPLLLIADVILRIILFFVIGVRLKLQPNILPLVSSAAVMMALKSNCTVRIQKYLCIPVLVIVIKRTFVQPEYFCPVI